MSTIAPEPDKRPLDAVPGPESGDRARPSESSEEPIIIHVSAFAYLRTMWSLLWTAFRHPLTTTYIDVVTGEVLYGYEEEI